jgi:hypothetical protein
MNRNLAADAATAVIEATSSIRNLRQRGNHPVDHDPDLGPRTRPIAGGR